MTVEEISRTLTMSGVNAELRPLVRMTAPAPWATRPIFDWPEQKLLFTSWILLLGVLPIDRHAFSLRSVIPEIHGNAETLAVFVNDQQALDPPTQYRAGPGWLQGDGHRGLPVPVAAAGLLAETCVSTGFQAATQKSEVKVWQAC